MWILQNDTAFGGMPVCFLKFSNTTQLTGLEAGNYGFGQARHISLAER